ncbi:26S protease regulatory subunit 6A [Musa troglodytarum]|uniref:26S protease regulatory subunit 6A n=1 Tax=Musa troglodytarum TaxID=320322 RepID=A0A9E7FY55_9LILI|nr:26S protease regulatory subunit 6A [Musa troglodytarum]
MATATAMAEDPNFEDDQLSSMSTDDIIRASRLLDNEIRILKDELHRSNLELESCKEKIKENQEKIKLNKQLPYLVGNIVEILEMNPEEEAEEDGANVDLDSQRKGKCVVLKTSTRQTIFLPVVGLVDPDKLKPGDLVGVNKDSYLILDTLPSEYDSRVKAMEVDEKPTEDYNDIGGLEKQIQELVEAIVLPMSHKDRFQKLGIRPPKGVLLYGPPGTGKTLMARACAAQTNATFLKLAGPQLVQMFIGDGAKLVRDAFQLAKEKSPCIIFIDEIDAIGTKRFDSEVSGDREVQRTMLELLNQLDGFSSDDSIKVIAATNRADILDPALVRSGRLDRKIEFPHPSEEARARILQIHSRKMNVHPDVNFEELARSTDDFNGAQLKAVCVEAGMLALRRDATEVTHEDFNEGIIQVKMLCQSLSFSSLSNYSWLQEPAPRKQLFFSNMVILVMSFQIKHRRRACINPTSSVAAIVAQPRRVPTPFSQVILIPRNEEEEEEGSLEVEELAEKEEDDAVPRRPGDAGDGEEGAELDGLEGVRDLGHPMGGVHPLPAQIHPRLRVAPQKVVE